MKVEAFQLEAFQEECVQAILHHAQTHASGAVCLPTGAGKTVIAAAALARRYLEDPRGRTVILAHSTELLDQWEREIRRQVPHATVSTVRGGREKDWSGDIVVASVRALWASGKSPVRELMWLLVDECHHAHAREWQQAMNTFTPGYTLGLTASPVRGDGHCIMEVFGPIFYLLDLHRLIDLKRLVDARGWRRRTDSNLSDIPLSGDGDYNLTALSSRINTPSRNRQAIEAYKQWGEGRPALAFCADVAHAQAIAEEARRQGFRADAVHGGLSTGARRDILEAFKQGALDLVANCGVLTEGYDAPHATVALLARPYTKTSARVLLPQSVGRVLRIAPGKPYAIVIELIDRDAAGRRGDLDDVFGVSLGTCQGKLLSQVASEQRDRENQRLIRELIGAVRAFVVPLCGEGYERPVLAEAWERFDVISHIEDASGLNWLRLGPGRDYLNLGSQQHPDNPNRTVPRSAEIRPTTGGLYAAWLREGGNIIPLTVATSEEEARATASWQLVARNDPGLAVAWSRAVWRGDVATEAQRAVLQRLTGLPERVFAQLDRGRASDIISALQGTKVR